MLLGLAGCSSPPPSAPAVPPGALFAGSAQVTIDDSNTISSRVASCLTIGSWTKISIGDSSAGVRITIDSTNQLTAREVAINNLGGFTGSYWDDLPGDGRVGMVDQTYTVTGAARGFSGDNPSFSTPKSFTVKVAC
jgi:lipoprotein LpqH